MHAARATAAGLLGALGAFALSACGADNRQPSSPSADPAATAASVYEPTGPGPERDAAVRLLARLERRVPPAVGDAFACVVMPAAGREPLLVHVADEADAVAVARRAVRRAGGTRETARVRTAEADQRANVRRRLIAELRAERPFPEIVIQPEPSVGRRQCPRAAVTLRSIHADEPEQEAWASDLVERYGTDRVVIERSEAEQSA